MNQSEINELSEEELKELSPFERKSCYDCSYCQAALSWWCKNKEAIEYRGTCIPGCIKCPFWKPDWEWIDEKYKTKENGFKEETEALYDTMEKFNNKKDTFTDQLYKLLRIDKLVKWISK